MFIMAVPLIYFLDDDENIIRLVKYGLRNEQFNMKFFNRPTALIDAIKAEYPDVVISDVMMPDMDGIELIDKLRELSRSMPVIPQPPPCSRKVRRVQRGRYGCPVPVWM